MTGSSLSNPGSLTPKEVSVSFVLENEGRPRSAVSRIGSCRPPRMRTRKEMLSPRLSPILSESDEDYVPGTPTDHDHLKDFESNVGYATDIQSIDQDSTAYSAKGLKSSANYSTQSVVSRKQCSDYHDVESDNGVRWYDGPGRYPGSFAAVDVTPGLNNEPTGLGSRKDRLDSTPNKIQGNVLSRGTELKMKKDVDCSLESSAGCTVEPVVGNHAYSVESSESSGLEGYSSEKFKDENTVSVKDVRTIISGTVRLLEAQIAFLESKLQQSQNDTSVSNNQGLLFVNLEGEMMLVKRRLHCRKETLKGILQWYDDYTW